ncbi:hypothetical protein AGI3411_01902 [Achromobacter agilis]|uniref:Uncharacterized protein n=1 Tax=Achromobacter agilis TaxID=1353888 RepID=A0A446CB36_9BURK|nr:hypothetical protein AGI3411_01902 [Achromobacter agilis]
MGGTLVPVFWMTKVNLGAARWSNMERRVYLSPPLIIMERR